MGFEPQLRKILGQVRPDRQVCLFLVKLVLLIFSSGIYNLVVIE